MTFTSKVKLGFSWVTDSLRLFKQHPAKWMGLSVLYVVFLELLPFLFLLFLPFLLSKVDSTLIQSSGRMLEHLLGWGLAFCWLVFTSFIVGVCRETDANRSTPMIVVFTRITPHLNQLMLLGAVIYVYQLFMREVTISDLQSLEGLDANRIEMEGVPVTFWWLAFKLLVLRIPLFLATWYSPLLVSYHQYSVFKSIGHSVWASLKNIVSLITAWLVMIVVVVLAMVALGLAVGVIAGLISLLSKDLALAFAGTALLFAFAMYCFMLFSIQYFSFLSMYYKKGEDFVS